MLIKDVAPDLFSYIASLNGEEIFLESQIMLQNIIRARAALNELSASVENESIPFEELLYFLKVDMENITRHHTALKVIEIKFQGNSSV